MNKEAIQELGKMLKPLTEKLGVAAEQVFEWAIRQNYVYVISDLIVLVIAIISGAIFFKTYKDIKVEPDMLGVVSVISGMIFAVAIFACFVGFSTFIARLVNPEWMALQDIISALKLGK